MKENNSPDWKHYVLGLTFAVTAINTFTVLWMSKFFSVEIGNFSGLINFTLEFAFSLLMGFIFSLLAYASFDGLCKSGKQFDQVLFTMFDNRSRQKTGSLVLKILSVSFVVTAILYFCSF